jgi:hypothetical protein
LGYLLPGNNRADFACLCLKADGSCLDRDRLFDRAKLQVEVEPDAIADIEHNAVLLCCFESGSLCLQTVMADREAGNDIAPACVCCNACVRPVSMLVAMTATSGSTDADGSITMPTMVASCPRAGSAVPESSAQITHTLLHLGRSKRRRSLARYIALLPPASPQKRRGILPRLNTVDAILFLQPASHKNQKKTVSG